MFLKVVRGTHFLYTRSLRPIPNISLHPFVACFPLTGSRVTSAKWSQFSRQVFFAGGRSRPALRGGGLSVASSSPLQAFKTNLEEMEKFLIFFDVSIPSYYLIMRLDWWNVEGVTNLNCKSKSRFSCQVDELTIRAWFRSLQQQLLRGAGDEIVMRCRRCVDALQKMNLWCVDRDQSGSYHTSHTSSLQSTWAWPCLITFQTTYLMPVW